MDKRYQVFISSTYSDLQDERKKVMHTILSLGCIPAGMELFPAMDEEQFEFIKRVIDDCDYYILIIGGRYGSVDEEGISFTEKEYQYAVLKGLPVLAFLHEDLNSIPLGKSEIIETKRERLIKFRGEVTKGRLVQFWRDIEDLNGKVAVSLSQVIKQQPAVGWVRGNASSKFDQVTFYSLPPDEEQLFISDTCSEVIEVEYSISMFRPSERFSLSWRGGIVTLSPSFLLGSTETEICHALERSKKDYFPIFNDPGFKVKQESVRDIIDYLFSRGIIQEVRRKSGNIIWGFTEAGKRIMLRLKNGD